MFFDPLIVPEGWAYTLAKPLAWFDPVFVFPSPAFNAAWAIGSNVVVGGAF